MNFTSPVINLTGDKILELDGHRIIIMLIIATIVVVTVPLLTTVSSGMVFIRGGS